MGELLLAHHDRTHTKFPTVPFARATSFRRLVRDYERLPQTLAGLHLVAFATLMLRHAANLVTLHNSLLRLFTPQRGAL